VRTSRAIEDLTIMSWAIGALDDNVRYCVGTLATRHASTPEEQAEWDKDNADLQQRLNSPGPGLMEWDRASTVIDRYKRK